MLTIVIPQKQNAFYKLTPLSPKSFHKKLNARWFSANQIPRS